MYLKISFIAKYISFDLSHISILDKMKVQDFFFRLKWCLTNTVQYSSHTFISCSSLQCSALALTSSRSLPTLAKVLILPAKFGVTPLHLLPLVWRYSDRNLKARHACPRLKKGMSQLCRPVCKLLHQNSKFYFSFWSCSFPCTQVAKRLLWDST